MAPNTRANAAFNAGVAAGANSEAKKGRVCLVTVGATVAFRRLLEEVMDQNFITGLEEMGFTTIYLQTHGDDEDWAKNAATLIETEIDFKIYPYFTPSALREVVEMCRGNAADGTSGVVIAHGGSGTITEVRRLEAPLVLRANSSLADNHQDETINDAVERGWAFKAEPGDLQTAVTQALKSVETDLVVSDPHNDERFDAWLAGVKAAEAEDE